MTPLSTRRIAFAEGREAIAVIAPEDAPGEDLVDALGLPAPRGAVALCGGTEELESPLEAALARALGKGLAREARAGRLTLVTGGTNAGVFALLGAALGGKRSPTCVGVAVSDLVAWPGVHGDASRVPLEPHHTHFVLVRGGEWGDETPALLALMAALGRQAPTVAVIAGGGEITRREALGHATAGRPLIVLEGSGRFADELSASWGRDPGEAPADLREILESGDVEIVPLTLGPQGLAEAVRRRVGIRQRGRRPPALLRRLPRLRWRDPTIDPIVPPREARAHPELEDAFTELDRELVPALTRMELDARRAQNQYWSEQLLLIAGGAAATILGACQAAFTGQTWPGITEAVLAGLISAVALRTRELAAKERFLASRLKAERLKSEYFMYLGRAGDYAEEPAGGRLTLLRQRVVQIETDQEPGS